MRAVFGSFRKRQVNRNGTAILWLFIDPTIAKHRIHFASGTGLELAPFGLSCLSLLVVYRLNQPGSKHDPFGGDDGSEGCLGKFDFIQ